MPDPDRPADPDGAEQKRRMLAGEPYRADNPVLIADAQRADRLLRRFNDIGADEPDRRFALLRELLGAVGDGAVVRPPFHCDYGALIRLGAGSFVNFGAVFLDVAPIVVGAQCQLGPSVQLLAADHPRDPALRRQGWESGRPIHIGDNAWLGGGAIVLPGITVGADAIVGAGSVVTRDVPPGQTVAGNPARPVRPRGRPAPG